MIQCAHDPWTATSVNQFGELAEEFPAATALVCRAWHLLLHYLLPTEGALPLEQKVHSGEVFKVC